jgi:hypothetical protein
VIRAFTHKLADIPDGVTVSSSDLAGKRLLEGTPVGGKDSDGIYHVVKVAALAVDVVAAATGYPVLKGHHFKVGDVIMLKEGGKASAITAIDTSGASSDTLTCATLSVAATAGSVVYEAKVATTGSDSGLRYVPEALVGDSYDVEGQTNLFVEAWTIGQIREGNVPAVGAVVKSKLKGIVFI